jgi:uncharacterized protein (DUF1810 family)
MTARDVLGSIDAMKLQSSMTLFAHAATNTPVFEQVLDRLYGGERDTRTEALLRSPAT